MPVNEYKVNGTALIQWSPICNTVHLHVTIRVIRQNATRRKSQCRMQVSARVTESYMTTNCQYLHVRCLEGIFGRLFNHYSKKCKFYILRVRTVDVHRIKSYLFRCTFVWRCFQSWITTAICLAFSLPFEHGKIVSVI